VRELHIPKESLRELHLFAGAGGGILGGMLLGHTCVCAVEIEPYCRNVLLQRQRDGILPKFPIWDDVRTFDGKLWRGNVDVICGGFPCQDTSVAGKGAGIDGARSGLWSEFARIIGEVQPLYVFVENSPALITRGLGRVLGDLSEMGYNAKWCTLGASDFGALHIRKRIWILAHSKDYYRRDSFGGRNRSSCEQRKESFGARSTDGLTGPSERCSTLSDSDSLRKQQSQGSEQDFGRRLGDSNSENDISYTSGERLERQREFRQSLCPKTLREIQTNNSFNDCTNSFWANDPADAEGAFESQLGRVANGVDNRVDRLKAIGNGQVPIVAASAFKLMKGLL